MKNTNNKQAFTLVELIVVITILAILGTIAFISLQGYSASARDSKRISDIQNIKKSLELFSINTGKYPFPDSPYEAIFSGSTMRTQGIVGDNMSTNLSRNLNEKPLDPLTELEYIYSTTYSQTEYEVLAIYESDVISYNTLSNQANSAIQDYPKIEGTYNGVAVKTPKFIVPTPSIINAELPINDEIDLETNIESQIVTGGSNLINNGTTQTGELDITFSSYEIPSFGIIDKEELGTVIQNTYSGSTDLNTGIYAEIVNTTDSSELVELIENTVLKNNIYIQTNKENYVSPICNELYIYQINTKKCESNPSCTSGYTYDILTNSCQKIETYAATTNRNISIKYKYVSRYYTVTTTYAQLTLLDSSGPTYLYASSVINSDGILTSSRMWKSRPGYSSDYYPTTALNLGYGQTKTFSAGSYSVTNLTTTSKVCVSGGILSGTTCTKTLTETPICLNEGILNISINKCQLDVICDNGWFFNEDIDKCQK